jgi:two-component sensor histidine kinase
LTGDTGKALENYTKSLNICDETGDNDGKAICLYDIGELMMKEALYSDPDGAGIKFDKARVSLEKSLTLSLQMDQKEQIMNIYHALYWIDSAKGNYINALRNYQLSVLYKDSIFTIESSNQVERLQYQFDSEQKKKEIIFLTQENEIKSLEFKNQEAALLASTLELSRNMSEVIWALNSRNDHLESLIAYIRKYAGNYFENSSIRFKMHAPAHVPDTHLNSDQRRNIFYAVKEALHNIVKHAKATEAELTITLEDQMIIITIRDNGIGLPAGELSRFGNGMIHMRERLKTINGDFTIKNGIGTTVKLSLPV